MSGDDLHILDSVLAWHTAGRRFHLATVLKTWGASPRPPGSWMAWRDDAAIVGSVSGGCIEDELLHRWRGGRLGTGAQPQCLIFGGPDDRTLRLPCGASVEVLVEPAPDIEALRRLRDGIAAGRSMARSLRLDNGQASISEAAPDAAFGLDAGVLTSIHGPRWRLFIVGACDIGRQLATLAGALDFVVSICDPREEYRASWTIADLPVLPGMPDDELLAWQADRRSAIVTVSHDPKLDDLALIDALQSPAFYVAAVGSQASSAKRRERLALFDLEPAAIKRLHAPAGLAIGSRTPAEIALSILAEMVALRSNTLRTQQPAAACALAVR